MMFYIRCECCLILMLARVTQGRADIFHLYPCNHQRGDLDYIGKGTNIILPANIIIVFIISITSNS